MPLFVVEPEGLAQTWVGGMGLATETCNRLVLQCKQDTNSGGRQEQVPGSWLHPGGGPLAGCR